MKIGFELELFCLKDGKPVLVPYALPKDECGWLVEVRSDPHADVRKAIALFKAEIDEVYRKAKKEDVELLRVPLYEVPRDLKVQAARAYTKGLLRYQNIYGHETHKNLAKYATAAIHISFTEERTFSYRTTGLCKECSRSESKEFKYQGFIDHAKLIVGLDTAFKKEITKAKRNPGFYEVKSDGRIEYRSLPNDVDLDKVGDVLEVLLDGKKYVEPEEKFIHADEDEGEE